MTKLEQYLSFCTVTINGCYEYKGKTRTDGYARVMYQNKHWLLHRLTYHLKSGKPIPDGLCVLHTCDNRCCINPDHLWLGTKQDNSNDAMNKGRLKGVNKGNKNGRSKLTQDLIPEIKKQWNSGLSVTNLAKKLKVSKSTIYRVITGESWV